MKFIQDNIVGMQGFDAVFIFHQATVRHELNVRKFHIQILDLRLIYVFAWGKP